MKMKRLVNLACTAGAAVLAAAPALAQAPAGVVSPLPYDTPTVVNGIDSVCTGTGESDENNRRWATYPVKVVLAGKEGQYLAGATVTVSQGAKPLLTVSCNGPWILFRLAPGRYSLSATLNGETETGNAYASQSGQGQVTLRFLDQGGTISPQGMPGAQQPPQQPPQQ
ncbi:MAG TPA: hypothetical protein VHX61_04305 [Rhizomicrobium sp.]|jgi:hypothetical protein|nr:hypothetical protein [Rhizomicrobium sp.]